MASHPAPAPTNSLPGVQRTQDEDDDDDDDDEEASRVSEEDSAVDEEPEYDPSSSSEPEFPITHEATLKEHTKIISALTLDPSGARVLSGSHDYDCKLWDFGGMTTQTRSFKTWEPAGSYYVGALCIGTLECDSDWVCQVNDLKYSNDGQQFLVVSATIQPKLYDRDGEEK